MGSFKDNKDSLWCFMGRGGKGDAFIPRLSLKAITFLNAVQ